MFRERVVQIGRVQTASRHLPLSLTQVRSIAALRYLHAHATSSASLVGNITIPLTLIMLVASFARLHVPRPLSRMPIMAMLAVTLAKMVITPVFGIFMVQRMTTGGFIDRSAKVERFVAMFLSGTPAAVK